MFLIAVKFLAKIFSVLNSEESPRQIAAGFAIGAWIGLIPVGFLPSFMLFCCFLINVNLATLALAAGIFKVVAFAVDPAANKLGYLLLARTDVLRPLWTRLYNLPIVPYTRFNNTIVMGSLVIGLVLLIPLYLAAGAGLKAYRARWRDQIRDSHFMKALKASTFYKYYEMYRNIRGQ